MLTSSLVLLFALSLQEPASPPQEPDVPAPVVKPRPKRERPPITVDAVNAAVFTKDLQLKSYGADVLRVEILLDRAKFSPGEIDGLFGHNLEHTVVAYRRAHNLPLDPVVDATVWGLLNADTAPLFIDYMLEPGDTKGPFEPVPHDMMGKSHLKQLGYESCAELLGEKFHINPKLLVQLNPGKSLEEPVEMISAPNVLTPPPPRPASLCINGTDLTLQGLDADGHILMSYPVSVGSKHDPLPVGQLQVMTVHMNPVYSYDSAHFWDSAGARAKARIAPGPNNPVGLVWIGLSKNHYGIHGTPSPGLIGRGQSHGCIRMTNWAVTELAGLVSPNLNVVLKTE